MSTADSRTSTARWPWRHRFSPSTALAFLSFLLALGACSAVPDWVDPTRIFDKTNDQVPDRLDAKEIPARTPDLSSVPEEPRPFSPKASRDELTEGLIADHDDALNSRLQLRGEADETPVAYGADSAFSLNDSDDTQPPIVAEAADAPATGQLAAIIYFDQDDTALNSKDHEILRAIAALHEERGGKLRVVGHSASGSVNEQESRGLELSLEAAKTVTGALLELGIDQDRLIAEAKSGSRSVPSEATPGATAGHRRVEIFLEN